MKRTMLTGRKTALISAAVILNCNIIGLAYTISGSGMIVMRDSETIYNVSFPVSSAAYFDPGNSSGRGQVFSDSYMVENYGNTDVAVKIKNIEISHGASEGLYELFENEAAASGSEAGKLKLSMIWVNESENMEKELRVAEGSPDEYVLFLKASEYDRDGGFAGLDEGSAGFFYFTGGLNSIPESAWENGEITIRFDYEIVNANGEEIWKDISGLKREEGLEE